MKRLLRASAVLSGNRSLNSAGKVFAALNEHVIPTEGRNPSAYAQEHI
jgi:hypothetical protein